MFNRVWATPVSACDRSLVDRQLSLLCIRHVEVDARSELSLQAHLSLYRHRWSLKPVSYRRLRQVTYVGLTPRELNVCTKGDSVWSIYDSLHLYVTQDRTHLTRTAAKMKSRNNLISKLADNSGCKYHLHVSSSPLQIAIHFCAPPPTKLRAAEATMLSLCTVPLSRCIVPTSSFLNIFQWNVGS